MHHEYNKKDVEIFEERALYQGFLKVSEFRFRHKRFDGEMSETVVRECLQRQPAVAVLPYDAVNDQVVLIEQIRVGALSSERSPWQLEIIAGICDKDESFEVVAQREAEEEAGLTFDRLLPITQYYPSSGGCDEKIHLFLGLCDLSEVDTGVYSLEEEHEDISRYKMSFDEAYNKTISGEIENAAALVALLWLKVNKNNLA